MKGEIFREKYKVLSALLLVAGVLVSLYIIFGLDIFDPNWGAPLTPTRLLLSWPPAFLLGSGMAILVMREQMNKPSWLVPVGQYVEGMKPRIWSPKRLIQIVLGGIIIFVFKMAQIGIPGVSLGAIGLLFVACYFGPITAFFAIGLQSLLSASTGLAGGALMGMLGFPVIWFYDGSIYALAGWFFRKYVWSHRSKERIKRYLPFFAVWNAWHFLLWTIIFIPIATGPAWMGMLATYIPSNYPTNIISGAIGVGAVETIAQRV